jgi:hypothetical protein
VWLGKLAGLAAAIVAFFVIAGIATSCLVASRAAEVAGSSPYCVEVAEGSDYKPARSLLDLSAWRMRAKHEAGLSMQHHAILVVGAETNPRLFHWSYQRRQFVEGVINETLEGRGPAITCLPKPEFTASLPAMIPQVAENSYVRFSPQEAYRIPISYQATWSGGASRTLRIATAAPDFLPLDQRWSDLPPAARDSNWVFVEWNPGWVLSLMKSAPGEVIVEEGTEFGLSKVKTVFHGKDQKDYVGYRYLVYANEESIGVNTTVISCGTSSAAFPKPCQHRFLSKGRHFYFRHRPEDVADWHAMQRRVLDLFASFEVRSDGTGKQ